MGILDSNFELGSKIRSHILTIIRHSNDFPQNYIRLHKNENPIVIDRKILKKIKKKVNAQLIYQYFDLSELYEKIADKYEIGLSNFILTAGSDLGLKTIYELFTTKGGSVLVPEYKYAMHDIYIKINQVEKIEYNLAEGSSIVIDNILSKINNKVQIIFLESPNGTSGQILSQVDLDKLVQISLINKCIIVIDECYAGIQTNYLDISNFENVLSLRSFSKNLGLAGVRAGVTVGSNQLIEVLQKAKPMHEISSFSAQVLKVLLENNVNKQIAKTRKHLNKMCKLLRRNLIDYEITNANFILIRERKKVNDLRIFLLKNKIVIPKQIDKGYLKNYYRVSIGSKKDFKKFIKVMLKY